MKCKIKKGFIIITPLCTLLLNMCYYSFFYFILYQQLQMIFSEVILWGGFIVVSINVIGCYRIATIRYKSKEEYTDKEKYTFYLVLSMVNVVFHMVGAYVIGEVFGWGVMENYGMYYCMLNIWILILMCLIVVFNMLRLFAVYFIK